jgi:diguanylate cyclase
MTVAAASLTAFGMRQRRYDGWRLWVVAVWLTAAGTALAAAAPGPWGEGVARMLLLQWPVLTLVGLRRFHPRQALPGHALHDWAVLAGAMLVIGLSAAGGVPATSQALALAASLAVHLYAATLLFMGPGGREFAPVQGLAATLVVLALAAGVAALPGSEGLTPLAASVGSATLGAIVTAFVALTLVCERTERQLRDSRRRLRTLANLDTLTQVPNRRHFQELADRALRQDEPGTAVLVMFDVDHFKRINDLFGHTAGDRALRLVSSAMLDCLRSHDVPGRQGGDEFVLLLRRTTPDDAFSVAARITTEVQRRTSGQQLPTLTLSFGLVQIGFGEGTAAALRRADQAMYEAKRQGRARAVTAAGNEHQPVFATSRRLGLLPA